MEPTETPTPKPARPTIEIVKSLKEEYEHFLAMCYDKELPVKIERELRRTFYSGALTGIKLCSIDNAANSARRHREAVVELEALVKEDEIRTRSGL